MPPFALLFDAATGRWLRFAAPREVIAVRDPASVRRALAAVVRRAAAQRLWAVGWVAYEAAPAFDPALAAHPPEADAPPLLLFALCPPPEGLDGDPRTAAPPLPAGGYQLGPWRPSVDDAGYRAALAGIRRRIARGDTYQVNYTYRLRASFRGDPRGLFRDLVAAQGGDCGGWIDAGRHAVCCASPEQFFRLDDAAGDAHRGVVMRPMKGTARRGRWGAEDGERHRRLTASEKERAENVMIVDMVRNDLGRVAEPGSVGVDALFTAERYPTLWQLTSTVSARTRAAADEVFAALFPCASITGAPKPRTSEIIAALEDGPRGVYTGAVGWFTPGGGADFRVAIRTAVVDRRRDAVEYGVGGGIVWDSRPAAEAAEARTKARVLAPAAGAAAGFELLETLLWRRADGFHLLREHLERAAESAEYFGYHWRAEEARRMLETAVEGTADLLRVRLLVARDGSCRAEATPLAPAELGAPTRAEAVNLEPLSLALAAEPVDPDDPFLFHKTTRRQVYDAALAAARRCHPACADVVLWNPRREVTETTTANLVVERDGALVTPPVSCGLLAGTLRRRLLESGEVEEGVVRLEELSKLQPVWVVSSLRGWRPGVLPESGLHLQ